MAFCNSCGTELEPGARFCPKCGAPSGVALAVAAPASSAVISPSRSSSVNTVLIIVGILFGLFVVGTIAAVVVVKRIAQHTRVHQSGDNVRVETPFGTVESSADPDDIFRELGPAVYPGSRMDKGNASRADIAGAHTISAQFTSDEAAAKVAAYYKRSYPDANVSVVSDDHYTIVSTANQNVITISVNPDAGKSQIFITSVGGKHAGGRSGD